MNDPHRSENYRKCGLIRTVSKSGHFHTVYGLIHETANLGTPNYVKWKKNRNVNLMSVV